MSLPTPAPDRTALVTGTSSGIGVEIARELAARGHGLTLVARREDRLQALAAELGTPVEVIAADLSDPAARTDVLDEIGRRGLTVDILVNNAGLGTLGRVAELAPDDELRMLRVNIEALVDLTTRVVPGMVERRSGAILNVASTAAFQPLPGQAGYAATKAFVLSYTEALRIEVKDAGVTVTALCPGPVRTEFASAAGLSEQLFDESLPAFMFVTAAEVAKAGVDGLVRGRGVVIPGRTNEVAARVSSLLPRRLLLPVLARQHPGLR
jgi:short-subunit dehydrogenase